MRITFQTLILKYFIVSIRLISFKRYGKNIRLNTPFKDFLLIKHSVYCVKVIYEIHQYVLNDKINVDSS